LPEHEEDDLKAEADAVVNYIEASLGKEFAVKVIFSLRFPTKNGVRLWSVSTAKRVVQQHADLKNCTGRRDFAKQA
jgi:hypothetical protein